MSTQAFSLDPRPVEPQQRIPALDVIRGLAIVGILFVTVQFYGAPAYHTGLMASTHSLAGMMVLAVQFLAQGKMDALFAMLFGLGITMQMAGDANGMAGKIVVRRLLFLAVIGILHMSLLWYGDLILFYAVLGLLLLPLLRLPSRALLPFAAACLLFPAVFGLVKIRFHFPTPADAHSTASTPQRSDRTGAAAQQAAKLAAQQSVRVYSAGSFSEVAAQRWHDVVIRVVPTAISLPHLFGTFLIGVYFGRRRLSAYLHGQTDWLRRVFWWSLGTGLAANAISAGLRLVARPQVMPAWLLVPAQTTFYIGGPLLACAFGSGILLLFQRGGRAAKMLSILSPAGRMALTNCLLQSLVCTTLFYGYGFGLYGKLDPLALAGIAAAIVIGEVVLSRFWLRRFPFGPAEWLSRFVTYGRAPESRRSVAVSA